MSTQKGNSNRSRSQKYKNQTAFKNDLHDKSHKRKLINSIEVANVCKRCQKIIEWKIKYKKYKPLKAPSKCIKCEQKAVKQAYHNMCLTCAKQYKVCAKCGDNGEIVEGKPDKQEAIKLDAELQGLLKELSERKRRTFIRYMNRNATNKKNKHEESNEEERILEEKEQNNIATEEPVSREDLLLKLQSLMIKEENDDSDDFNTDDDDDDDSDYDSDPFV